MRELWIIYKNETVFLLLVGGLFLWGVVATILAFQNKEKTILIGTKDGFYQLIENKVKAPLEMENFIRHFLSLTLNFDEKSYGRHISLAGDLMTDKFWFKKKAEFKEMAGFIKKNQVVQSSEILSITKQKENLFEVKIKNFLFKKGILSEKEKVIFLSLVENERSFENPWSYSISNMEVK